MSLTGVYQGINIPRSPESTSLPLAKCVGPRAAEFLRILLRGIQISACIWFIASFMVMGLVVQVTCRRLPYASLLKRT